MRYIVTKPVEGGTAWYDVHDTEDQYEPNFVVASFFKKLPNASS